MSVHGQDETGLDKAGRGPRRRKKSLKSSRGPMGGFIRGTAGCVRIWWEGQVPLCWGERARTGTGMANRAALTRMIGWGRLLDRAWWKEG